MNADEIQNTSAIVGVLIIIVHHIIPSEVLFPTSEEFMIKNAQIEQFLKNRSRLQNMPTFTFVELSTFRSVSTERCLAILFTKAASLANYSRI